MRRSSKPSASGRCMLNRECRKCNKIPDIGYTFAQVVNCDYVCYECKRKGQLEAARKITEED